MTQMASLRRRYWTIAVLGSAAFHAAILFVPLGVSEPKERVPTMLQVALSRSGPWAEQKEQLARVPTYEELSPAASDIAAPLARAPTHASEASSKDATAAPRSALIGEPSIAAAQAETLPPIDALLSAQNVAPPETSPPIDAELSPSVSDIAAPPAPAPLARIFIRESSRSTDAETPQSNVGGSAQNALPPSPITSSTALSDASRSAQNVAPAAQNYFKNARNLLSPTKESFAIAATVLDPVSTESKPVSQADPPQPESAFPSRESAPRAASSIVALAPEAYAPPSSLDPQNPSAQALEPGSTSTHSTTSTVETSSLSSKASPVNAQVKNYFSNHEILSMKSTVDQRGVAQDSNQTASIGAGAAVPLPADVGGGEDTSLSPENLKGEMRVARTLDPPSILSGGALATNVTTIVSVSESGGAQNSGEKIVSGPPKESANSQVLTPAVEPSSSEQTHAAEHAATNKDAVSTAAATLAASSDALAQTTASQPIIPASATLSVNPPVHDAARASAISPASDSAVPQPPIPLAAMAEGLAQKPSATREHAPHYDSAETLASRVLVELSARKLYPMAALRRKIEGTVTLLLSVEKDGRLVSATLQARSGSSILDEAALSLARGIFPIEIHLAAPISLVVPIEYRIPR